jgi:hypothetical protein
MAKRSGNSGKFKQDLIISGFERDIRNERYRTQLNITEQCIQNSEKMKTPVEQPRFSFYNPNNPLNGFRAKSKAEQKLITARLKAEQKAIAKLSNQ